MSLGKIYYAHPMSWYDTKRERDDIAALEADGWDVLNPNTPHYEQLAAIHRADGDVMRPFRDAVQHDADAIAFRAFDDGLLDSGVAQELMQAIIFDKPVYQLFGRERAKNHVKAYRRHFGTHFPPFLTVAETKTRIKEGIL